MSLGYPLFLLMLLGTATPPALGSDSGEEVYREVCAACHAAKFDKAPQLGDRKAWAPLIKEGQHVLTAHAWVGVRDILMDYIKHDGLRLALQVLTVLLLAGYVSWAIEILWR